MSSSKKARVETSSQTSDTDTNADLIKKRQPKRRITPDQSLSSASKHLALIILGINLELKNRKDLEIVIFATDLISKLRIREFVAEIDLYRNGLKKKGAASTSGSEVSDDGKKKNDKVFTPIESDSKSCVASSIRQFGKQMYCLFSRIMDESDSYSKEFKMKLCNDALAAWSKVSWALDLLDDQIKKTGTQNAVEGECLK